MVALVAGGTGFIGRHIVRSLISLGIQVRLLVRINHPLESFNRDVELIAGDLLDVGSLKACTRGADLVFSVFGLLGRWRVPERKYWEVNSQGVRNLLESCLEADIRQFIHISSAGVLGPLPRGVVANESFPFNPSNIYEMTKCQAERDVRAVCEKHELPFTIIRPEFVYGPGDTHVLGFFRAIERRRFFVLGDGQSLLHPTYIDDLVRGIELCVNNRTAFGQTYLIVGEKPFSVKDLATIIAQELGVEPRKIAIPWPIAQAAALGFELVGRILRAEPAVTRSRVRFFTQNRAFTFEKARAELGFVPQVGFREGARRTIRWYRDNGSL